MKFSPGNNVAYMPRVSPSIEMRETVIAAVDEVREFNWKKMPCSLTGDSRPTKVDSGTKQQRYVIEHFFGWYPTHQSDISQETLSKLDLSKRYYFAYESELKRND